MNDWVNISSFSATHELLLRRKKEKHTISDIEKYITEDKTINKKVIIEYPKIYNVMILGTTIIWYARGP